jgi:hypothetical protein
VAEIRPIGRAKIVGKRETEQPFPLTLRLKSLDSCFFMLRTLPILGCSISEAEAMPVACYRSARPLHMKTARKPTNLFVGGIADLLYERIK